MIKTLQQEIDDNFRDSIISEYATTVEQLRELDIYELAQERADSCQEVIYYNKAQELIINSNSSDVAEAEELIIDSGFEFRSYNETVTLLAYHIVRKEIEDNVRTEVNELIAVVVNYEERMIEELDKYKEGSDEHEAISDEISLAQELISSLEIK